MRVWSDHLNGIPGSDPVSQFSTLLHATWPKSVCIYNVYIKHTKTIKSVIILTAAVNCVPSLADAALPQVAELTVNFTAFDVVFYLRCGRVLGRDNDLFLRERVKRRPRGGQLRARTCRSVFIRRRRRRRPPCGCANTKRMPYSLTKLLKTEFNNT